MKEHPTSSLRPAWLSLALLMSLIACNQPEEGCLDIQAANYNVEADRPCAGCCTYPTFRVDLLHKVIRGDTEENLLFDSLAYTDGGGQRFGLLSLKFYLSRLRLVRSGGEAIPSFDTIGLRFPQMPGDTLVFPVEDNFALADPANFRQRVMGAFRAQGQMEEIRFLWGLPDTANAADPAYVPEGHPLSDEEMYINGEEGHIFSRLEVFTLTSPTDTVRTLLEISGEDKLRQLAFPASFYLDPGFSPVMVFRINYADWFAAIDLEGKSEEEMERDLLEAMPASVELMSVTTRLN